VKRLFYQPPSKTMASDSPYTRDQDEIEEWTRNDIEERMKNENRWLIGGLITLYEHQTESEKRSKTTQKRNDVGFSSSDAEFLTDVAEWAVKSKEKYGKPRLSEAQIEAVRDSIMKYSQQLADLANGDR